MRPTLVLQFGHTDGVTATALSPDGRTLATGSDDRTVKLWDAASGAVRATLDQHWRRVDSVAFSLDGNTLATGSQDGTVKLCLPSPQTERRWQSAEAGWTRSGPA